MEENLNKMNYLPVLSNKLKSAKTFPLLVLIFVYLLTRLINLIQLPMFVDEAMYLNWGRLIWYDPLSNLFISLTDGQQPLFIWLTSLAYGLGQANYLFWGRIISVLSGLASMFLLYRIGQKLWHQRIGLIAATFYLISPFALWYDRLAIKDSFLLFLAILLIFLSLGKLDKIKVLFSGLVLGAALLTKSIAYFYIVNMIITFSLQFILGLNKLKNQKYSYILYLFAILVIGVGFSQIMRFSPDYALIAGKNQGFLLTIEELLQNPFIQIKNNLYQLIEWDYIYFGFGLLALALLGLAKYWDKNKQVLLMLASWSYLPVIVELFMATIFFPRYTIMQIIFLFFAAALGIEYLYNKYKSKRFFTILILIAVFWVNIRLSAQIIINPAIANLPTIERWQYLESWPSGYGMQSVVDYLNQQSISSSINVIVEDITLTPATFGLELKNATIRVGIFSNTVVFPYEQLVDNKKNYVVLANRQEFLEGWPLSMIFESPRVGDKNRIRVYQVMK